jgi:hypothetical protein
LVAGDISNKPLLISKNIDRNGQAKGKNSWIQTYYEGLASKRIIPIYRELTRFKKAHVMNKEGNVRIGRNQKNNTSCR